MVKHVGATTGRYWRLLSNLLVFVALLGLANTQLCAQGRFGPPGCSGICRCLNGPEVCANEDGACLDSFCDYGWTESPRCQKPCNNTFGLQCVYTCHCPPTDKCNPVNGLCSSGKCNSEWYGAGCQIRLPKLISPASFVNVTCGRAVLQWDAWTADFDNGNGPVHSYSIWHRVNRVNPWTLRTNVPVARDVQIYNLTVSIAQPEVEIQFRVDTNMLDDGKRVIGPPGVPTAGLYASCTTTPKTTPKPSPSTTTTPKSTTPTRPPGDRILNTVTIGDVGLNFVLFNWTFLANVTSQTVSMSVSFRQSGVGDCNKTAGNIFTEPIDQSAGAFLLQGLVPWRKYDILVIAVDQFNRTDPVALQVETSETAPSGTIASGDISLERAEADSLSVSWNPPRCDQRGGVLLYYEIRVKSLANDSYTWDLRSNATSVTIPELSPFTRYAVSVRYVNAVRKGDFGGAAVFRTTEDVPGPPVINVTLPSVDSIFVAWFKPDSANGVIRSYGITFRDEDGLETTVTSQLTQITLPGLKAYTQYIIRVRAETSTGWGNYSDPRTVRTLQSTPSHPLDLKQIGKNETCVEIDWKAPAEPNGVLLRYQISYKQIFTHNALGLNGTVLLLSLPANSTSAVVCNLQEATYYQMEVVASTTAGAGQLSDSLQLWTLQGVPDAPPQPKVTAFNQTTITLSLEPVTVTKGPLTAYRIVVEKVADKRRKRASDIGLDLGGYTAAEMTPAEVPSQTVFVVGDQKTYGGFLNRQLTQDKVYDIAFVVVSELEGVSRASYSRIPEPVQTSVPGEPVAEGNVLQTVGIVIGVLLLLLIILLIVFFLWYRRNKGSKYFAFSSYNKDNDKVKLTLHSEDEDLLKYWSKTQSFAQRRHVVAGQQYLQTRRGIYPQDVADKKASKEGKQFVSLHKEFYSLPHKKKSCTAANKNRNKKLNRFDHLLAFDHSRVVLRPDENSDNDYVNANYIDGYKRRSAYIAAMSPFNEETVMEFWRMIYQLRLPVVVMITKVEEEQFIKCTQYWPDVKGVVTFANFILQVEEVEEFADYVIRVISLKGREEKDIHTVRVFDYLSWPVHGVPTDAIPLLEMQRKVKLSMADDSPLLVHCGTGVGRTGAYIAIDGLLEQYYAENEVNVYQFVKKMRENRKSMVRTIRQYAFIYDALFEAVVIGDLYVGEDLKERYKDMILRNNKTGHTFLKDQFLSLQEYTPKLKRSECQAGLLPANLSKNRYPDLVPPDSCRPIINTLGGPQRTDYINAVFLDGHRRKNHYILTQTPLPSTVLDFWKLVYEYKVTTIVMMEERKTEKEHARYWPEDESSQLDTRPYVVENLDSTAEGDDGQILISSFRVHNLQNPRSQPREVKIFQLQSWSGPSFVPSSKTVLLDMIDLVEDWQTFSSGDTTPVLVHCSDGATQSGLFCAISIVCGKMLHEGAVDVYHVVKHLKRRRPQIIDQLEQYRFCYKTLWDFISLRLSEKSFSQGSVTQADRLYAAPSLNLSLYSSIYDVEDDYKPFQNEGNRVLGSHQSNISTFYKDGYI